MSYEFIKLSEVEVIETSTTANLLIEEDGEIKRLPASNFNTTPNVQADWNETDDTSPAYIANKPESLGGGAEIIRFYQNSGMFYDRAGNLTTASQIYDAWVNGATFIDTTNIDEESRVVRISYSTGSGTNTINGISLYYMDSCGNLTSTYLYD